MSDTSSSVRLRGFENLSSLLSDEPDPLRDMIQRRLHGAVAKRRLDRAAKYPSEPKHAPKAKQLEAQEMLDLLGQLNRPKPRASAPVV